MKIILEKVKYLAVFALLPLMITSCIKNDVKVLGDTGTARVKLGESPRNIQYFSPYSGTKTIDLATVRREEVSQSGVNQPLEVFLTLKKDSIGAYNEEHGSSFESMPDSIYNLVTTNGVTKVNDSTYKITFAPGVTAVPISVRVNGDKWNFARTYGVYYVLSDPSGRVINSGQSELFAAIAIKNTWDGVYEVTGTMTDVTNATLTHINNFLSSANNTTGVEPPLQMDLRTTGMTTCVRYDDYFFGGYYIPITSGNTYSQYGSFDIIVEFDPATNKIINCTNYYGQPASNGRYASLDPSAPNVYDPATKTIEIGFRMHQPASVPAAPHVRTTWRETWKFIRERS